MSGVKIEELNFEPEDLGKEGTTTDAPQDFSDQNRSATDQPPPTNAVDSLPVLTPDRRLTPLSTGRAEALIDRLLCVASRFQFSFFPRSFLC